MLVSAASNGVSAAAEIAAEMMDPLDPPVLLVAVLQAGEANDDGLSLQSQSCWFGVCHNCCLGLLFIFLIYVL